MFIKNWFYLKKDAPGIQRDTITDTENTFVNIVDVNSPNSGNIISVSNFTALTRPYKVYTALLTQSGGDVSHVVQSVDNGSLIIGVTYEIAFYETGDDFTNVGAPTNANGVKFVATGTTAANWNTSGTTELNYNTGAPIATVLENTIGDVWFTYGAPGVYYVNSNGLFTENKSTIVIGNVTWDGGSGIIKSGFDGNSYGIINTALANGDPQDNASLINTPIEIRVYN
jgi:hypothetical protein